MGDVDPVLVAVSDVLILDALTRAWARTVKRANRSVPAAARHNQYMKTPVGEDRIDAVMHDAWCLCPTLVARHNVDVDPQEWAQRLDGYTRALLMMGMPHTPTGLIQLLSHPWLVTDEDDWSGGG